MSAAAVDDAAFAAESNLPTILGVLTTFFFLAFIVVSMRMYVRLVVTHSFGTDDVLIAIAMSKHGLGHHQSTISPSELVAFNRASFWGNVIEIAVGTMFLKLGIAVNLLRLCKNRWYMLALWVIIGIVIAYELVAILFFFLNCRPVAGNWDPKIGAKCSPIPTVVIFGLVNTSGNIVTDVALAIIPIPIIWALNMRRTTRLYLVGILSLGYLAVAMDVVKTYYQETYTAFTDETFTFSLIFFGFLYGCLGLIASSVPMLKPLVSKALGLESDYDRSYYIYGSGDNGANSNNGGSNARTRVVRGGTANLSVVEAGGYELNERGSDTGGNVSLNSDLKGEETTSASAYLHNTGSQEHILHYHQPGSVITTSIGNGMTGPPKTPRGSNLRGIRKTTEVSVS